MNRKEPFNIDAGDNQDWTKQSWDLPPYKSEEFYEFLGEDELDHFRTLPVYRWAVKNGLIKDDEWVGEQMKPMRLPYGNPLIPKRAEGEGVVFGDGMMEVYSEDSEFRMLDDSLKEVEKKEEPTKYFAKIEYNRAVIVARLRIESDCSCYERWSWQEKRWVDGTEVFREMSGVGGDGFDWYDVTEEQADKHIKSRSVLNAFGNEQQD